MIIISILLIISYVLSNVLNDIIPISILNTLPRYFSLILVLGLLYRFLNRSNRILKYISESSYSVYLIHQPVIIVISYYYIEYINIINSFLGFLIVFIISTIVTYLLDYVLVRNTKLGAYLYTGKKNSVSLKNGEVDKIPV